MPRQKSNISRTAPGVGRRGRWAARAALLASLAALGCAVYQDVRVVSDPPGAEVFVDQNRVGVTPTQIRVSRLREHSVYVKKDGYTPELVVLSLRSGRDGRKFLIPADVYVDLLGRRGGGPGSEPGTAGSGEDGPGGRGAKGANPRDRELTIKPPVNPDAKNDPGKRAEPEEDGFPR